MHSRRWYVSDDQKYLFQFVNACLIRTLVWLKFHKELFDFNEDVYMCCAYIPPSNSSHHALYDCELFRVLENSIITYSTKGKVCLVGDLNSRTADYDDVITDDSVHSSLQDRLNNLFTYTNDLCLSKRMNPDKVMQVYWIKDTKRSSWKWICD